MKILLAGGGLQGLSCGASLYKKHKVSLVGKSLQTEKSCFFDKCYGFVKGGGDDIIDIIKNDDFDVILPISDFTVPFISQHKKEIEEKYGVKCAVPDYEQVFIVEDKSRFMDFCDANELPHPKTRRLSDDSLEKTADFVGFPSLIKPDYSVGARGITRVNSIEELKEQYPCVSAKFGSCTLQELIENQEYYYNVMLYRNNEGKILASTILKIVRMYPVSAGSSSCCITVENEDLVKICANCLDKMNWVGMADFDVLQRLDTKEFKVIEINPRVPASLRGAAISGVNFPEIIINDVMGIDIPEYEYHPGKIMRYFGLDIMWFLKSPTRFRSNPSWFKFTGHNIYYQDIYKEDCSTWWTWVMEGVKKIRKKNKKLR